jgi:hypothetical protein
MQTRLPNHGGLTPPALVLVYGRLRVKKRFLRCANAHSQERRASARRGSVTHLQRRFVEATGRRNRRVAVSLLQTRLANHGWLTPAAPGARRLLAATCAICDLQTHMQPRAAGDKQCCCRNAATASGAANFFHATNSSCVANSRSAAGSCYRCWSGVGAGASALISPCGRSGRVSRPHCNGSSCT